MDAPPASPPVGGIERGLRSGSERAPRPSCCVLLTSCATLMSSRTRGSYRLMPLASLHNPRTIVTPAFFYSAPARFHGESANAGRERVDTYAQEPIMDCVGSVRAPLISPSLRPLDTSDNLSNRRTSHFFMSFSPIPYVDSLPTRTCSHDAARKFGRRQQKGGCDGSTMPREASYLDRRVKSAQAHGPGWALAASFSLKQPESNYERSKGVHETHNLRFFRFSWSPLSWRPWPVLSSQPLRSPVRRPACRWPPTVPSTRWWRLWPAPPRRRM